MSKRLPPTAKPPKEGGGGGAEQGTGKTKGEQKATVHTFNDIGPAFKAFLYDKSNVQLDKLFSQLEEKTQLQREHVIFIPISNFSSLPKIRPWHLLPLGSRHGSFLEGEKALRSVCVAKRSIASLTSRW